MEPGSQTPNEFHVSASVGSVEDLDFLDEDLLETQGPSEMGFLGRNSQVQWMRALERKLEQPESESHDLLYAPPGDSEDAINKRAEAFHQRRQRSSDAGRLVDYYFYLDNNKIDHVEDVDPYVVPPPKTAEKLFASYQVAVHTPFRVLEDDFEAQLRTFYQLDQRGGAVNVSVQWKAVLNLVFAIGARFLHLIGADWQADDRDHLVYMSRASHFLQLDKISILVRAPDMYLIQATGLFSFYYLIIGHVSRAWYMIGISIRHAQAAGMHLRNEDRSVSLDRKRTMAQTWWALHSIECILTSITGRPRTIHQKDCTVPLLTSLTEGNLYAQKSSQEKPEPQLKHTASGSSSASGHIPTRLDSTNAFMDNDTFLNAWTKLDLIQHKCLNNLFSAETAMHPWKHMQDEISSLTVELNEWALQSLPHSSFGLASTELGLPRERLLLFFYYQSVKICITRPCLCRLDRRIKAQSEESAAFNRNTASACVQAALDLTSSLPESANPRWLYGKGPWWSAVHIIMQAITVLLLEMAQTGNELSKEPSDIIACVEKLVRWLRAMKQIDGVAERAYSTVYKTLSKHESFARKMFPTQWDTMQSTDLDSTTSASKAPQPHHIDNPEFSSEAMWPSMPVNDDFYTAANQGNFNLNIHADPLINDSLNDPFASFQFGQTQYPLSYGNQFTTIYDQDMTYDYGDNTQLEDWTAMDEEQQPPQ